MSDTVIKVENLSKQYRIGAREAGYRTFRETIMDAAKAPFQKIARLFNCQSSIVNRQSEETIWALRNVSFDVKRGEVVGIIGRNGAGKSTLLKILSKITEPTEGRVELRGRIGSLLEVGTGFHPELTGHENVYLYGAILGMNRWEITRKFDEIIAFAEMEKFIDTPVKRYSSGMYMRLAFAVAAHLEPEILLVDEVLAVGDAAFQKKCLGKMGDVAHEGRTVLFVSHNMGAIRILCKKGLLLDSGRLSESGDIRECIKTYLTSGNITKNYIIDHVSHQDKDVQLDSITVNGSSNDLLELQANTRILKIEFAGHLSMSVNLEIEARIYDLYGTPLGYFSPGHSKGERNYLPKGQFHITRSLKLPRIMKGTYFVSLYLTDPNIHGWVDIPDGLKVVAEGTTTSTGMVFDYQDGLGWVFISEADDNE
jgi:lipopolysaccharide transport system ATP-binding protein